MSLICVILTLYVAWKDGGNSTAEEYDPSPTCTARTYWTNNDIAGPRGEDAQKNGERGTQSFRRCAEINRSEGEIIPEKEAL